MLPHEEFLKKALEDCEISTLVCDLGRLYVQLANNPKNSDDAFRVSLEVDKILRKASVKIANLGTKPYIPNPRDKSPSL